MRTWIEDEDRSGVHISFGEFKREKELERYVAKKFRKELKLPAEGADATLEHYGLETCLSPRPGDLVGLVGKLGCSQSFIGLVKKAAQKVDCSSYNGSIALFDFFTEDDFADDTSLVDFIGSFTFDSGSNTLVSLEPSCLNEKKVSVWSGTFSSKEEFYSYFNLPDHLPPEDDAEWQNPFAEDYKIELYEEEFASYNLSRAMRPKPIGDLLSPIPMTQKLQKAIVTVAGEQGTTEGNAVYVAFEFDYDDASSGLTKKPESRHDFQCVGTLDKPSGIKTLK